MDVTDKFTLSAGTDTGTDTAHMAHESAPLPATSDSAARAESEQDGAKHAAAQRYVESLLGVDTAAAIYHSCAVFMCVHNVCWMCEPCPCGDD